MSGAADRFRNSYLQWEFANHCQCKAAPGTVPQPVPSALSGHCDGVDPCGVRWVGDEFGPANCDAQLVVNSMQANGVQVAAGADSYACLAVFTRPPAVGEGIGLGGNGCVYVHSDLAVGVAAPFPYLDQPGHWPVFGFQAASGNAFTWDASFNLTPCTPAGTPYVAAALPPAPRDTPAAPGCPPAGNFQDLANQLCDLARVVDILSGKLDYLAAALTPPTSTPDDQPTPAPAGEKLEKPDRAVGCVVELTSVPSGTAHYGSPGYMPNVAWIVQWTDAGPLGSVMLRHNPEVVIFQSPQVNRVSLDLVTGAVGQVRFLNPPK